MNALGSRIFMVLLLLGSTALAQKKYDANYLDQEIENIIRYKKSGNQEQYIKSALALYEMSLSWQEGIEDPAPLHYYCKMLSNVGLKEAAIHQMEKYLDKNTSKLDDTLNRKFRVSLAQFYIGLGQLDNAKRVYQESASYNAVFPKGQMTPSVANNLGYAFMKTGALDSALHYYNYVQSFYPKWPENRTAFRISLLYNYAQVYFMKEDYQRAKTYYEKGVTVSKEKQAKSRFLIQGELGMLHCDTRLKKIAQLPSKVAQIETLITNESVPFQEAYYPKIYLIQEEMYRLRGNELKAKSAKIDYLNFQNELKDSKLAYTRLLQSELSRLSLNIANESLQLKDAQLQSSKEKVSLLKSRNSLLILFIASIAILGGIALIYLIKYFRKKKQQVTLMQELVSKTSYLLKTEKQLKQSIESEMKVKLELKEKDLSNLALEISRKRQWMQELKTRLNALPKEERLREVNRWIIEGTYIDKKQEHFTEMVESVNEKFYQELKSRFPNLTPKELELCGFIKLNLNTKEIALNKQVTPDSVKTARKRLRRKLNVEPNGDLYGFIQGIG